ncbi:MAG: alpha/beta fold hydrolase [Flagellimonas sp.]
MKKAILIILAAIIASCSHKQNEAFNNEHFSELSEWYLKTKKNWYSTPKLYVKEIGSGTDTVIMVHGGWGAEHSYFLDAIKGLEDKYHFVFYDQRGSLRSPCPDSLITLDKHVEDIELLRKELKISKLKLAAHSQGTFLTSAYLKKYPEHVENIVFIGLVKPVSTIPAEDTLLYQNYQHEFNKFTQRQELMDMLSKHKLEPDKQRLNSKERTMQWKLFYAAVNLYDLSKWQQMKGGQAFYNQNAANATLKSYYNDGWNFLNIYKDAEIPITVINAEYDLPDCNSRLITKWLKDIPNIEVKVLEKAGHNSWTDQPELFKSYFDSALKK